MPQILTRAGKASALTHGEMDTNLKEAAQAKSGAYTVAESDNRDTIQCTGTFTVDLPDAAATASASDTGDFKVTIKVITGVITVGRVTAGDTIDGTAGDDTLRAGSSSTYKINPAGDGYIKQGFDEGKSLVTTAGDILYASAAGILARLGIGTDGQVLATNAGATAPVWWAPRGHISGLTLSNDTDTDHDINITAGEATDSTNAYVLKLTSEITKQIDAVWAAGDDAGGLFSGTVANTTWYNLFLIRKDSDGSIDAGFDGSVIAANIPSGYTAFRRVGAVRTDGSANILQFIQTGELVMWITPITDVADTNPGVSAVTIAFTVPADVVCLAFINAFVKNTGGVENRLYVSPLTSTDQAPSGGTEGLVMVTGLGTTVGGGTQAHILTDGSASSAARYRLNASDANTTVGIFCLGYYDYRHKYD